MAIRTDSHNPDSLRREKCVMETLKLGMSGTPFQTLVHPQAGREPRARWGLTSTHCRGPPRTNWKFSAFTHRVYIQWLFGTIGPQNRHTEAQIRYDRGATKPSPQSAPTTPGDRTKAAQSLHRICLSFHRGCQAPSLWDGPRGRVDTGPLFLAQDPLPPDGQQAEAGLSANNWPRNRPHGRHVVYYIFFYEPVLSGHGPCHKASTSMPGKHAVSPMSLE